MRRIVPLTLVVAICACEPDDGPINWDGISGDAVDTTYDYDPGDGPDVSANDHDGDGYTIGEGDCDDSLAKVNPGAYDDPDNGVDDDCDTIADNPAAGCDCDASANLVQGMDLCDPRFVVSFTELGAAPDAALGRGVREHYGLSGNHLGVRTGCAYSLLGTGAIDPVVESGENRQPGTDFYADTMIECPGTEPDPDPDGGGGSIEICDTNQLSVHLQAPTNAVGFSFDFVYLSTEYPEWVGMGYNDTFYAILERESGPRQNISFDDYGAEIEVDNAFFENPPVTNLGGTGYSDMCMDLFGVEEVCGSSTGWLRTSWDVEPGEDFTLTFSIHDEGDGIYDSVVILDNFQWSLEAVDPGTIII